MKYLPLWDMIMLLISALHSNDIGAILLLSFKINKCLFLLHSNIQLYHPKHLLHRIRHDLEGL